MLMLLAAFGVVQVLMSVALVFYVRRSADEFFSAELADTVEAITRDVRLIPSPLTDASLADIAGAQENGILWQRCAVSVYSEDGMLIASSIRPAIPVSAVGATSEAAQSSQPLISSVKLPDFPNQASQTSSRVVGVPFLDDSNRRRILLVAAPETFVSQLSERVTTSVVVMTPIGLVVAATVGWLIAGVAVRPLRQLGDIASRLGPDNLSQPIDFHSSASELTVLKEELDQMRHRLETGYEAQERFVANVSHEIKTPIATVLTEAQTLARPEANPAEVRQFIDSTQDEMRRLGRLVESFLLLTRVRHGKPLASTARGVAVNDIVLDSVQNCWKAAEEHDVRLVPELAIEDELDLSVHGDPELLQTLLDNLTRNAIRFAPRGSPITLVVKPEGTDKVCICVRDEGPGIAANLLDRIFDRFAQAKYEEKLGRGSGLGLEIAQGIAELHGGHISVCNLPERGCEFCVTLPLQASLIEAR